MNVLALRDVVFRRGRIVASGPIHATVTTETVSRAFEHPIGVTHHDGRWGARALRAAAVC